MRLIPDASTFAVLPWRKREDGASARMICDVYDTSTGEPFEGDPRYVLKQAIKRAEDMGYTLNVGPEPEFFVFEKNGDGRATTTTHDAGGYFDLGPKDLASDLRREIIFNLEAMGFEMVGTEQSPGDTPGDERTRFTASGPIGKHVDVLPTIEGGRQGHGTVHHVAFQTPTDEDQAAMRDAIQSLGLRPTNQIDRHWFRSVYVREFNGVLFELATSGPGYTSDEPLDDLGGRLVLPGKFENRREEIEAGLPDVTVPRAATADVYD